MSNDSPAVISGNLDADINMIKSIFGENDTLLIRYIENSGNPSIKFSFIYMDGMVDNKILDQDLLRPLAEYRFMPGQSDLIDIVANRVILSNSVGKTACVDKLTQAIVCGDSVLLCEGCAEALTLNTKGWSTRSITEPENEKVLRGPREGFVESIMVNLSMLRRRIKSPDLKMEFMTFGTRTKTKTCICYLDTLVNKNVLAELKKRLNSFSIDGILDANYIAEFISDAPHSPVRTTGSTEKPDVAAAKLLEGRVAIFIDGTPMILTCPYLFIENFQSGDDYYINYFFSSIGRILRILAFFISTGTPAVYVALTTFHQEMLPTPMIMSITTARQGVPFPTVIEAALMITSFEILREAGTRMPNSIGQALSIVGALVLGQAAVDAKIISAPMIIVAALAGITGLMMQKIKGLLIILRFVLLGLASIIGLYGYMFGMLGVLIHLFNLSSFGVPIMDSENTWNPAKNKDHFIRAPWWRMTNRPHGLSSDDVRQVNNITGQSK